MTTNAPHSASKTVHLNITLPKPLANELRTFTKSQGISQFIAAAIRERLLSERLQHLTQKKAKRRL